MMDPLFPLPDDVTTFVNLDSLRGTDAADLPAHPTLPSLYLTILLSKSLLHCSLIVGG